MGHGSLEVLGYATPTKMGGTLSAQAHLKRNWSLAAEGWAGSSRITTRDTWKTDYGVYAGVRKIW